MRISDWSSDVCSSDLPSRYHSVRAISAPPRRPAQVIRIPSAPRRRADWTTRFIARRKATRRDRKSGGEGKSVSVRVDLGGRRSLEKKKILSKDIVRI